MEIFLLIFWLAEGTGGGRFTWLKRQGEPVSMPFGSSIFCAEVGVALVQG